MSGADGLAVESSNEDDASTDSSSESGADGTKDEDGHSAAADPSKNDTDVDRSDNEESDNNQSDGNKSETGNSDADSSAPDQPGPSFSSSNDPEASGGEKPESDWLADSENEPVPPQAERGPSPYLVTTGVTLPYIIIAGGAALMLTGTAVMIMVRRREA